eukprot:364813-Chlamydomonas_euryale.AAC.7
MTAAAAEHRRVGAPVQGGGESEDTDSYMLAKRRGQGPPATRAAVCARQLPPPTIHTTLASAM